MAVYTDCPLFRRKNGKKRYAHVWADTVLELHRFMEALGIGRHWFENKRGRGFPHYDVPAERFQEIISAGALVRGFKGACDRVKS